MSQRGWLFISVVLLISMAFAGCLGDEDEPGTGTDTDTGGDDGNDGTDDKNETGDGGSGGDADPAPGEAPTAAFDFLPATSIVTGANVTFNASASEDPEGTNLTFAWDLGDNTTMKEGVEVIHVYEKAGNYTVVLTVTDADGLTATTNQSLTVAAASTDYADWAYGNVTAPNPLFAVMLSETEMSTYESAGVDGVNYFKVVFTGVPKTGTKLTFEVESETLTANLVVFDPDGKRLGAGAFPSGQPKVELTQEAALTHGSYTVFVFSSAVPDMSFKLTATLE